MPTSSHILIFEPEHSGHQPAFIRMIVEHVRANADGLRLTLAVHPDLVARIQAEDDASFRCDEQIRMHELSDREVAACTTGSLPARAWQRWQLCRTAQARTGAHHAHFLYLDHMQLPLAVPWLAPKGVSFSGILFRPSVHEIYASTDAPRLAEWFREKRKRILYGAMLRNPALAVAFSLDPFFPDFADRTWSGGTGKVIPLTDPIAALPSDTRGAKPDDYRQKSDPQNKVRFLLFGALSERKGVHRVLEAIQMTDATHRESLHLILAGSMEPATRAIIRNTLADQPELRKCVTVLDRFLTTPELTWMVQHCDVVLAPYQRFVGSSGTLIWAAAFGKPVLAQSYGLIGALVRQYALGVSADTEDSSALADGLVSILQPGRLAEMRAAMRGEEFLQGREPAAFAGKWLKTLNPFARPC